MTPVTHLVLEWPPVPEHMTDHADLIVTKAAEISAVTLDYTVESLRDVESLLEVFHQAGDDPGLMAETVFRFGAYVGEVMVRNADARWVLLPEGHPLGAMWPMIETADEQLVNPIGKVYKRIAYGEVESVAYLYQAFIVGKPGHPPLDA
jgi:hypothetical protein